MLNTIRIPIVVIALVLAQAALSVRLNAWTLLPANLPTQPEASTRWDPEVFKILTFGNLPTAVDWLWIRVLADARTTRLPKGTHPSIYYDLSLAADLDPAFFDLYKAGANLLAVVRDDGEGARDLLEKGNLFRKTRLPGFSQKLKDDYWTYEWSLPLLLAYVYLFELNDLPNASKAFLEAAAVPNAPPYLLSLQNRLERPGGQYEVGMRLLNFMVDGATDPDAREALIKKRSSLGVAQFVFEMNYAFTEFLKSQPRYKESHTISSEQMKSYWRAFMKGGHYSERDPWGGRISMNSGGRVISSTPFESVFGLDGVN